MPPASTEQVLTLFWSAGKRLRQHLTYKSPVSHLTLAQLELLKIVSEKGRIAMKDAAECLAVTPPSATVMVNHLVKIKLLERRPDPSDRRGIYLRLTKKGAEVFQKAKKRQQKEMHQLLRHVTKAERNQLAAILKKMSQTH